MTARLLCTSLSNDRQRQPMAVWADSVALGQATSSTRTAASSTASTVRAAPREAPPLAACPCIPHGGCPAYGVQFDEARPYHGVRIVYRRIVCKHTRGVRLCPYVHTIRPYHDVRMACNLMNLGRGGHLPRAPAYPMGVYVWDGRITYTPSYTLCGRGRRRHLPRAPACFSGGCPRVWWCAIL
jgi:hypothetical protein